MENIFPEYNLKKVQQFVFESSSSQYHFEEYE
jgi:hypothetical protein